MPPKLALLICTVFVLFLLRMERKQSPQVSRALWVPTSWMLIIASKPLGTWFQSGGGGEAGSLLDQLFLIALFCLSLLILESRSFNWSRAMKGNTWLCLLIGYMFCSVLWSDIPFISFKRWIRELIAVLMAFLVLSEQDPRQAMQSLFKRTIYILIPFSIILIKYFPEYGVQFRNQGGMMWIGATLQKNSLGRLCLTAVFFLIWTLLQRWQGRDMPADKHQTLADLSILALTLYIMSGPEGQYSATAVASLSAGLGAFFIMLLMKKRRINLGANTLTVIMAAIISIGVLQPFIGGSAVSGFASTLGRDSTLTGRTEIWEALVPLVMRQPIFGSGLGSYCSPTDREMEKICEAHNGYLEVVLDFGFAGLLFFVMFLLSSCRKAQRKLGHDFDWASFQICFFLMALIHNMAESSINSFTSQLTAVLLFLTVSSTTATSRTPEITPIRTSTRNTKFLPYSRKKKTTAASIQSVNHR